MSGSYFVTVSSLFVICLLCAYSLQEKTTLEDCGCSATSRKQSSVVQTDDQSGDTPTESDDTPPCNSGLDEKRLVATVTHLLCPPSYFSERRR